MIYIPALSQNKLKQIRKLKNKKFRIEHGLYLCEGIRLIKTAMESNAYITDIVFSQDVLSRQEIKPIIEYARSHDIHLSSCNPNQFKSLSEEKTPAGILFLVKSIRPAAGEINDISEPVLVYLENISDPGNLGAIIRSAVWFGINTILLSPGCVDSTNPKVVRSSAGALFSCNIFQDIGPVDLIRHFRHKNYRFVAAVPAGEANLAKWSNRDPHIICLGSEANGLSQELRSQCDHLIRIPGSGKVESLNLAVSAAIFFYELTKQRYER